jgi:type III restriction enzyme
LANPYLQVNTADLAAWLELYIRQRLFNGSFEPMVDENWRVLLLQPVIDHITKVVALALVEAEERPQIGNSEVYFRQLSELQKWPMREKHSLEVSKCIYPRLPYPARNGGLEQAFIEWANVDSSVQAFCKISETKHDFVRLRYVKEDGLPAFYSPDFLLRTDKVVYLVETKAQGQLSSPNVQRKLKAAATWCERINALSEEERDGLTWHYVLLGEAVFFDWRGKSERLTALCDFARVRGRPLVDSQQRLDWD